MEERGESRETIESYLSNHHVELNEGQSIEDAFSKINLGSWRASMLRKALSPSQNDPVAYFKAEGIPMQTMAFDKMIEKARCKAYGKEAFLIDLNEDTGEMTMNGISRPHARSLAIELGVIKYSKANLG